MPKLILIGGASGSGKTYFAQKLSEKIKQESLLVTMDNFYLDNRHLPTRKRHLLNFDDPYRFDWKLLNQSIGKLLKRKNTTIAIYSFKTHTREGKIKVKSKEIIILEGIYALFDKNLLEKATCRIFIDTPSDICFIRRLNRDRIERNRTTDNVIKQYSSTVRPMFYKYLIPTKRSSDLIIPGEKNESDIPLILKFINN